MWIFRLADAAPQPVTPAAGERDDDAVRDEVQNALVNILPWGVSLVFHAGLVLLAIFVVWSTIVQVQEEEVIVPVVKLSATPGAPLEVKEVERVKERTTERRTVQKTQVQPTVQNRVEMKTVLIGAKGLTSAKTAPFGTTLDAGSQFKVSTFGLGGNARRIVFVVDATGSLLDVFPFIISELKRTVQDLSEQQAFTIVFFSGDGVKEVPPAGLKSANAEIKGRVIEWIDPSSHNVVTRGQANPVEAIQNALRYRPELVFLLSDNITGDGQYEIDQKALLDEIKRANKANTKINTIQFIYPDPLAKLGLQGTMELIAAQSGGLYKFISAQELNIQ